MKDLALLHDKHMNRPTLDDSSEEEHAIEITTQEITQVHSLGRIMTRHLLQWIKKKVLFKLYFCDLTKTRPRETKTILYIFHN